MSVVQRAGLAPVTLCSHVLLASRVLMVRPAAFGFSVEAAASNVFQRGRDEEPTGVQALALAEFDGAVEALRAAGVTVEVALDNAQPAKPDAVFPNNWVSWNPDGSVILYPLALPSRRAERRREVWSWVRPGARLVDLGDLETDGAFVEGTGSLVFDHEARVAYACRSARTTDAGVHAVCQALDYTPVLFDAALDGVALYHTNVALALGPGFALWFGAGAGEGRAEVEARLVASGRRIVQLSASQVRSYCGNALALRGREPVMVMSRTASDALLDDIGRRVVLEIPTIERVGGGSARCMLAEVFEGG